MRGAAVTRYGIDRDRSELVAMWETGHGAVACRVAQLPDGLDERGRQGLAADLSGLSRVLWRCYTHPASAADSLEVNSEGWRRERARAAFASVVDRVREPNLPDEHGSLLLSSDPVEECAHRVGRRLHRADHGELTVAVVAEVQAELAAVERAELGDLSGRAVQAVQLTRRDASPVQVAAADQILASEPLGGEQLFLDLDPTSACVAAAHWLRAAAEVAAEVSGVAVTEVVVESDNISALPHATPTVVLELMDEGMSPTAAVTGLICDAMAVAEGDVPDLAALQNRIEQAEDGVARYAQGDPGAAAELARIRLTTLDPHRPARDMLEDLLSGIHGCWLVYQEHALVHGLAADEERDSDDRGADDGTDDDLYDDELYDDDPDDAIEAAFCDAVRIRATADGRRPDPGRTS